MDLKKLARCSETGNFVSRNTDTTVRDNQTVNDFFHQRQVKIKEIIYSGGR